MAENSELLEEKTHSFIVKVWLEESQEECGRAIWRGHITHVANANRRYIQHLVDIVVFILPYLQEMGANLGLFWRFIQWVFCQNKQSICEGQSNDEYRN